MQNRDKGDRFICRLENKSVPRILRVLFLASIALLLISAATYAGPSKNETIQINELKESYELTVPVSQLIMVIPKDGLSQKKIASGGSADNPRYFGFVNEALGLIISGWFESAQRFPGLQKSWDSDTKEWSRRGLPVPQGVAFVKISNWDAIVYDLRIPSGSNSHIRAHWLQADTWIDIHISMTSDRPSAESRAKLTALLKTIQVREKKN